MAKRINITLEDSIAKKLEELGAEIGLSRTAYIAYVVGVHVKQADALEPMKQEIAAKVGDLFTPEMIKQLAEMESESA